MVELSWALYCQGVILSRSHVNSDYRGSLCDIRVLREVEVWKSEFVLWGISFVGFFSWDGYVGNGWTHMDICSGCWIFDNDISVCWSVVWLRIAIQKHKNVHNSILLWGFDILFFFFNRFSFLGENNESLSNIKAASASLFSINSVTALENSLWSLSLLCSLNLLTIPCSTKSKISVY